MGTALTLLKLDYYGYKTEEGNMDRACSTHGRDEIRILVGKLDGKRPLVWCRHIWEDNIKTDIKEIGYDNV
jgi:hypothetical protein